MDERELTLAVVGIGYANADKSNRRFEIELCAPGDPIDLRREPKNSTTSSPCRCSAGGASSWISHRRTGAVDRREDRGRGGV